MTSSALSFLYLLFVTAALILALPQLASGQEPAAKEGKTWAILIAAEDYQKAARLQYTVNDVRQLKAVLLQRGGLELRQITTLTDDGKTADERPLKASIEKRVSQALKRVGPDDSVILYFSGHGFRDDAGRLYLAPLDCDPKNPAQTGVAAVWLREQIEACPAAFKLLVLDACHAGSEKGDEESPSVSAKDLGELFKSAAGVVTIASSKGEEKSRIWDFKQQSLFSYWLQEGLKGHADASGDGEIDIHELFEYVYSHVVETANIRFGRPQTPARIIGARVDGVPVVLRLRPQGLKQILTDMAEQLAGLMEERQLGRVGVLEFSSLTPEGEALGADFGFLGRYCADELQRRLLDRSRGKFEVLDRARLQETLKALNFGLADLQSDAALENLAKATNNTPVLATGTILGRSGRVVHLRCRVRETQGEKVVAEVGGVARLSDSEWGMLGRSVQVKPEDRLPLSAPGSTPQPVEDRLVEKLDARASGPHPFRDPRFPYRVRVLVGGQERAGSFQGNDFVVPLRRGEVYELRVQNNSGKAAIARVLVDGLNTLPEKEKDAKGIETMIVGKPVNIDEARYWVLDPADPLVVKENGRPTWAIRGFVTEASVQGKLRKFTVVDTEKSLAARQKFTDNIGLITAAFYEPRQKRIGTGLGEEVGAEIRRRDDLEPGNLLAVVHIRYVDAEAGR